MVQCCATENNPVAVKEKAAEYIAVSEINTLIFSEELCINCNICISVCPQGVFAQGADFIQIIRPDACMECGACQLNCPVNALMVDSGVGCAAAMISAALSGKSEVSCGGPEPDSCCC